MFLIFRDKVRFCANVRYSSGIHKNLFRCFSHATMRFAWRGQRVLHTDTLYYRDYVSPPPTRRDDPSGTTLVPWPVPFMNVGITRLWFLADSRRLRPSVGDFLKPDVILVCFISKTVDSRKPTAEWDVTLSRYRRPDSSQVIGCGVTFLSFKSTDWKNIITLHFQ